MSWFSKKSDEKKETPQEDVKTEESPEKEEGPGFGAKLKEKLAKTRDVLNTPIEDLFKGQTEITDDLLEELEETLITADLGVPTVMRLMESLEKQVGKKQVKTAEELKEALAQEMLELAAPPQAGDEPPPPKPHVIMVVGVNGVGKTTTIGKLAARYAKQGKKVLLVAADTFRAAAVEQLEIWAERTGSQLVKHRDNSDPAAVAFDGVAAAAARGMDVVIIDTAGRLHTKVNLMEELKKIRRSCAKSLGGAPHDTWLVIDANTGQNAVSQARLFHEAIGLTGIILTKVDGTAKGGIVISICHDLEAPVLFLGLGEKAEDMRKFDAKEFIEALI